ncbi:hypothetical protein KIPB_010183, partial [Kipferlia bialata]|eukprot:g10183.t1
MPPTLLTVKLHGFKSFASGANEEFNKHLNVIIGRNGSGKSNFYDAIRFALHDPDFDVRSDQARRELIH